MSRHFNDLDAVLEFDALDDFGQLIVALQSSGSPLSHVSNLSGSVSIER